MTKTILGVHCVTKLSVLNTLWVQNNVINISFLRPLCHFRVTRTNIDFCAEAVSLSEICFFFRIYKLKNEFQISEV